MSAPVCTVAGCSAALVARGLCRRHYQAAWKANELPPKKPIVRQTGFECPPEHKHDKNGTCYKVHRCRCVPCGNRASADSGQRNRLQAMGLWVDPYVSTLPARQHLLKLRAAGVGRRRVHALTGVPESVILKISGGKSSKCLRASSEAILALEPMTVKRASHAFVAVRGTKRRVQALVARGWSLHALSREMGLVGNNLQHTLQQDLVTQEKADEVAALYERLWNQLPPCETATQRTVVARTIRFARRRQWVPPLAWDDIDADDAPPVVDVEIDVDEMAVELAISGEGVRLRPAERRVAVTRLHRLHHSDLRIAATIGCNERTVLRIRQELGLEAFDYGDLEHERAS